MKGVDIGTNWYTTLRHVSQHFSSNNIEDPVRNENRDPREETKKGCTDSSISDLVPVGKTLTLRFSSYSISEIGVVTLGRSQESKEQHIFFYLGINKFYCIWIER